MKCILIVLAVSVATGGCLALQDNRDKRDAATTVADMKMLATSTANVTPAAIMQTNIPVMAMPMQPINQMTIAARYPNYPGFIFGTGVPSPVGLQTNIANPYPNFEAGLMGANPGAGGFGFGYQGTTPGFMYGNVYPGAQLMGGNGFLPQQQQPQPLDNYAALNNIINMANVQGLGAAGVPAAAAMLPGVYPGQGQGLPPYSPFTSSLLERMHMNVV